jgi:hypothetical protein
MAESGSKPWRLMRPGQKGTSNMKALSKSGLLLVTALMACAAFAVGAQANHGAVDINPDNTEITGTASNPTLNYEGVIVRCNTGTAHGWTNNNSDIVNVELTFSGNCNIAGLSATVTCSTASDPNPNDNEWGEIGTARLHALNPTSNTGEVDKLNTGFFCNVVVPGVCTVSVTTQDLPSNVDGNQGRVQANLLNEGAETPPTPVNDVIDSLVDVEASRTGSSLCGPAQGDGGFDGDYLLNKNVFFDVP